MQYMLWHTVFLNMSQRLKKARETALNWQMSLVHCLRWPGFALGGRAGGSQDHCWWRCLCTAQCWTKPKHSSKSMGNEVVLEILGLWAFVNVLFSFSVGFTVLNDGKERIYEVTLLNKMSLLFPE